MNQQTNKQTISGGDNLELENIHIDTIYIDMFNKQMSLASTKRATPYQLAVMLNKPANVVLDALIAYCYNNKLVIEREFNLNPLPERVVTVLNSHYNSLDSVIARKTGYLVSSVPRFRLRYDILKFHGLV